MIDLSPQAATHEAYPGAAAQLAEAKRIAREEVEAAAAKPVRPQTGITFAQVFWAVVLAQLFVVTVGTILKMLIH